MRREPVLNVPLVVVATIAVLALIHGGREFLGDEAELRLVFDLAFVPARLAAALGADPEALIEAARQGRGGAEGLDPAQRDLLARFVLEGGAKPWTLASYALLHGGWPHLILNGVWLLAFGSAVARRFGTARFLAFLVLTAIGGAAAHALAHRADIVPLIGASASVSGCMAAAIRFVFQPGGPLGGPLEGPLGGPLGRADGGLAEPGYAVPAQPLREALRDGRVLGFLGAWFGINLLTGLGAAPLGITDAAIAWEAHIGGFLVGLVAFPAFERAPALRPDAP